ncbi:hypothetical protein HCK00_21775 [Streptomyces sp. PLAI1-29]|uniref:Uncharacterized protein n=2 Tax=Streptomyces zingiberis TaxID=2053010 RepID=A0ABX1BZI6_9ACTN|nr:hypothetical protein [Streptomyces zingiberis]
MRALASELRPCDGVAVVNAGCLRIMEELTRRLVTGSFTDPGAVAGLGARLAGRYLAAVEADAAGLRPPACWRPLFRQRHHPGVLPVQFALAGVNAQIGHDLPLAVVDTCAALGRAPGTPCADHERMDDLLAVREERIREDLMPGPDLLDVADPLTHLTGAWRPSRARDEAWAAARVLWELRRADGPREEFRQRLDTGTGVVGRFLLTPLG